MAIHNKTGNRYQVIGLAKNATNGQEKSEPVVVYAKAGQIFIRLASEFMQKFSQESEVEYEIFKTIKEAKQ